VKDQRDNTSVLQYVLGFENDVGDWLPCVVPSRSLPGSCRFQEDGEQAFVIGEEHGWHGWLGWLGWLEWHWRTAQQSISMITSAPASVSCLEHFL
jgi:hypothetical protein